MRQLMISLDNKILDSNSPAAKRMIEYGKTSELFIIVPSLSTERVPLSNTVTVYGSGGSHKAAQFFKLARLGSRLIKQEKIESITTQDPFYTGMLGNWLSLWHRKPLEVQVHGDFYGGTYYKQSLYGLLRLVQSYKVLFRAHKIRTVGERVKQSLIKLKIPAQKIEVRPVPLNPNLKIDSGVSLPELYPNWKKIFLVLGRLDPVKNIAWLLNIFAEVIKKNPEVGLVIVGDGPEKENLQAQIAALSLTGNVRLERFTNEPGAYLKTCTAVLFPSLSESYGLVPIEASSVGATVIMNDVGVANYELKPSQKVKILQINDRQAWINAILSI